MYSQSDILHKDVYLVEPVDAPPTEESLGHLKAVCFLRPTGENITQLKRHLKNPRYGEYHLCELHQFWIFGLKLGLSLQGNCLPLNAARCTYCQLAVSQKKRENLSVGVPVVLSFLNQSSRMSDEYNDGYWNEFQVSKGSSVLTISNLWFAVFSNILKSTYIQILADADEHEVVRGVQVS